LDSDLVSCSLSLTHLKFPIKIVEFLDGFFIITMVDNFKIYVGICQAHLNITEVMNIFKNTYRGILGFLYNDSDEYFFLYFVMIIVEFSSLKK
jgi:hypothetical protein